MTDNYIRNYIKVGNVVTFQTANSVRYVVLSVDLKTKTAEIAQYFSPTKGSRFLFAPNQTAYNAKFPYTLYHASFSSLYCVYDSYGSKVRLGSDVKKEYLESWSNFEQLRLKNAKLRLSRIKSILESKTIQNLSTKAKLSILDLIELYSEDFQEQMYVRNKIFNLEV